MSASDPTAGPSSPGRTSYALLDALPASIPLPGPLGMARRLVDQHARIEIHDEGVTLTGLWGRTLPWDGITRIEVAPRLDDVVTFGLRLTPVGRLMRFARLPFSPDLEDVGSRWLVGAVERVAPGPVSWARDRLGWTVVRFHEGEHDTEMRRLPSLVAYLYPSATDHVVREAELRDIPVERRRSR